MWLTAILVGFVVSLVTKWIWDRQYAYGTFKRIGIRGPPPRFLLGNMREIRKQGMHPTLKKWRQEYGKTFGYFEATRPILVTSDLELLQQVTIQQFSKFHGRKRFTFDDGKNEFESVLDARGEKWKRLRTMSSQMFLGKRMKEISPIINNVIDRVMEIIEEEANKGKPFDIYGVFQRMTVEAISNVAFGVQTNALQDPSDVFLQKSRGMFIFSSDPPLSFRLFGLFAAILPYPLLIRGWKKLFIGNPLAWFHDMAKVIIMERMKTQSTRADFVHLMLNTRHPGSIQLSDLIARDEETQEESDQTDTPVTSSNGELKKALSDGEDCNERLSIKEMQGQSMVFLLAGYETTSTALGWLSYELAKNPDVQTKLAEEVHQYFGDPETLPDYHSVQQLPYLDMVVKESLRLHTIAVVALTRCTMENVTVKGIPFHPGLDIQVNPEDIHLDAEYWGPEDPLQFVPERFTKDRVQDRHPLAWMPFGAGPRNCIGMRLGLMEVKFAVVRILRDYEIRACSLTPENLQGKKNGTKSPEKEVFVEVVRRRY